MNMQAQAYRYYMKKSIVNFPVSTFVHNKLALVVMLLAIVLVSGCTTQQNALKKTAYIQVPSQPAAQNATAEQNPASEACEVKTQDVAGLPTEASDEPSDEGEALDPELTHEISESESDVITIDESDLTEQQQQALHKDDGIKFDLDVRETKEFLYYFNFYTGYRSNGKPGKGRRAFTRWLERAKPFLPYVRNAMNERGLPEDIIFLPFAESGYNPWAYSHAGAAGMWQFMPATGRIYGLKVDWWVDERRNPYKATYAAIDYLTRLNGMFDDWYLALAAYNAGEGKVSRAIKRSGCKDYFEIAKSSRHLKKETRHYVPKILAILKIVRNLEQLGFEPIDWSYDAGIEEITVSGGTDLLALSSAAGLKWKEFSHYNPAFRRSVSPPDMNMPVYLPKDKVKPALAYVNNPKSRPYAGYQRYKVRSGDSWWRIARRSGVPITVLKKVNSTRSNLLRPGQWLMIPRKGSALAVSTPIEKTRSYASKRANYIVRKGDSLWKISQKFGVSVTTIKQANGITNSRTLKVGQRLYVPSAGAAQATASARKADSVRREITYRVRRGDTMWSIARRYNVSLKQILTWNKMEKNSVIKPGMKLKILIN